VSRTVFLDTSAWYAALAPRDARHSLAARVYAEGRRAGITFLSTALVLAETHALIVSRRGPDAGRHFLEAVLRAPSHVIAPVDDALIHSAVDDWIAPYADQTFSLCDAVSFAVMRREAVARAFAFDRHFEVAGYELLT
jgi:predicted nucleic acid-binding protein